MTSTATDCTLCAIVPERILRNIAANADSAEARHAAQHTLTVSSAIRAQRAFAASVAHDIAAHLAAAGGPVPLSAPSVHREIYDSKTTEIFQDKLVRREGRPQTGDQDADNCYDIFGYVYEFYEKVFGRKSIDNRNMKLIGNVNYGEKYNNAFWNDRQMTFGDGDGIMFAHFPSSLDVVAHELTHGVTETTCRLLYTDQAGALNESVSDVFGSIFKQYHLTQTVDQANWLIGEGIFTPKIEADALRSMSNPGTAYDNTILGKDDQPSHMDGYVEGGDPHTNSGIPNNAFYRVAMAFGGNSWEKAGQIWYKTITSGSVKPTATFAQFAKVTRDVAKAEYGDSAATLVANAWSEVGVHVL